MTAEGHAQPKSASAPVAYLVIREGSSWRDVFRLTPGQVTTIGRSPTNRIVVRDDICSRNHCEIFQTGSTWTLRDLGSRNGTLLNGTRVVGDHELSDVDLIQIGSCDLGFTYDLSKPFPQFESSDGQRGDGETATDFVLDPITGPAEPEIIHRKRITRFRSPKDSDGLTRDRTSRELARLYRLALDMGTGRNAKELSETVLDGLFAGTSSNIGAILLLPNATKRDADPLQLRVVAYHSDTDYPYQKVSEYLSGLVLSERDAILARDVADDSRLVTRDSLGEIHAKSVICAPIQEGETLHGLVHLYSTNFDNPLDPDDLEFTLAVADQLAVAFGNLKEKERLAVGLAQAKDENETLRRQLAIDGDLVGDSSSMQQLRDTINRIAPTDATVLIRGESGVGKELVSRAIHIRSERHKEPFVCMNCAALTESLLESELFGHEKGSFTGAVGRKMGKFEQAHRGSLFLDEVGEMSLSIQAKFLRVLEGHPFERVGGGTAIKVDVRVIAATNRDLELAVEEQKFRKDLYFRLHVVELQVDPLRERRNDIPLLADFFLRRSARKTDRSVKGFTKEAIDMLVAYEWPGNVRELQNAVERAVILCNGSSVDVGDIQLTSLRLRDSRAPAPVGTASYRDVPLEVLEREHILETLDRLNWNKSRAAEILGIERSTLDRKLKRYEVNRPDSA